MMDVYRLKALTAEEFAELGVETVAYVKAVTLPEGLRFRIISANGETMAEAEDYDSARVAIDYLDLEPATVH